nr:alpha/beta hydrolase [Leptotrichia sp. OH3620_COT-345]
MKNAVIYIHGKGGNGREADRYKKFFSDEYEVIEFNYKSEFPWEIKIEFLKFFDHINSQYSEVLLIANSIGAYYSMLSLADKSIKKAMFISPIVDMEKLILNMMNCSNISEEELYKEKVITTSFGELLFWEYLSYVRKNPITWNTPTNILYAENDNMTSLETMMNFVNKIGANITVMNN